MSNNSNNYLGHALEWSDYGGKNDRAELPLDTPLVFRNKETGEMGFGSLHKISNGTMLTIGGHFDFDMPHLTENAEWASLEFVFRTTYD